MDGPDVEALREAALAGDLSALVAMGWRAMRGTGLAKDPEQAVWWMTQAARRGDVESQYQLGTWQSLLGRHAEAAEWFERAGEQGHALAQISLGHLHRWGCGVPADLALARACYARAAELGEPMGRTLLDALDEEA